MENLFCAASSWSRRLPVVGGCLLLSLLLGGAAPTKASPAHPAKAKPGNHPDKAWLSAKGICCFPLGSDDLPHTERQLSESMIDGWKGMLGLPDPSQAVDIEGGRYPAVDTMRLDLSHAVVNPSYKPTGIGDPKPTSKTLAVEHFEMVAAPMLSQKSRMNLQVTGRQVRLELQHDKEGKPLLMLSDAREGTLRFAVSHDDLQRMMLASIKEKARHYAIGVRSADVELRSLGPRSLSADLHVSTLVGFVPAGVRFTARVDIDDQMNAKISNLTCEGDEILGPLIVGLIHPGIVKYNNTTRPLLSFPTGNLKLRDVQIQAGDRVEMNARFSS